MSPVNEATLLLDPEAGISLKTEPAAKTTRRVAVAGGAGGGGGRGRAGVRDQLLQCT